MKKFEYAELIESYYHGSWVWLLDGEIVNPDIMTSLREVIYDSLSMIQALNILGEDGWQAVSVKFTDSGGDSAILMREVLE